jgi:hypothetical protein
MTNLRRYRFHLTSLALVTTLLSAAVPLGAGASTSPTAKSVIKSTTTALSKVSGVHIVVTSRSGTVNSTVVVDIGKSSGVETVSSGLKKITITVTPSFAYLSGTASGLSTIMGLTAAQIKKVGSNSISMAAGTTPFTNFQKNLTSPVLLGMLPASKGTTLKAGTHNSKKDYQLSWTTKASGTTPLTKSVLVIASDKASLPMKETIASSSGGGTTIFSKWGETVNVQVPGVSSIVTYKKVFG